MFKISNIFNKKKKKRNEIQDTEFDEKLKNNKIDNTELNMTGITEVDSCIVYMNNFSGFSELGKTQEQKEIMERELSCVKILIESTLTKYFLDSLDFFIKVNHENTKDFLDYLLTLDTETKQTRIYLLISGSIGDYIDFIGNYETHYGDRNNLIVGIILKHMQEIPLHYNQYKDINDIYDLHLGYSEFNNFQIKQTPQSKAALAKILSGTARGDYMVILDTTMLMNGYDKEYVPESWHRILDLFIKKEIDLKHFHVFFYCDSQIEKTMIKNNFLVTSVCDSNIYSINFSELFYLRSFFLEQNQELIDSIQMKNNEFLKEHSFEYQRKQDSDEDESITPLNMIDMVDEIIK